MKTKPKTQDSDRGGTSGDSSIIGDSPLLSLFSTKSVKVDLTDCVITQLVRLVNEFPEEFKSISKVFHTGLEALYNERTEEILNLEKGPTEQPENSEKEPQPVETPLEPVPSIENVSPPTPPKREGIFERIFKKKPKEPESPGVWS